jgi:thiol:disulfide interchange protein
VLTLVPACAPPAAPAPMIVQIPAAPLASAAPPREDALPPPRSRGSDDTFAWSSSEREAVGRARREQRPMILDFTAEWCGACKQLDRETYADPRVRVALQRFVRVKVDATNDDDPAVDAIKSRYKVIGLPTIIVLDSAGQESARAVNFVSPEQLITLLAPVK